MRAAYLDAAAAKTEQQSVMKANPFAAACPGSCPRMHPAGQGDEQNRDFAKGFLDATLELLSRAVIKPTPPRCREWRSAEQGRGPLAGRSGMDHL
jgi:hypothetical protein